MTGVRARVGEGRRPRATASIAVAGTLLAMFAVACVAVACSGGGAAKSSVSAKAAPTATRVAARPSTGCRSGATVAGADMRTVAVGSVPRTYRRYVPAADASTPLPVVINLHGLLSNIDQQVAITRFEDLAIEQRFIVLTPQGGGAPAHWDTSAGAGNQDVAFIRSMLDEVESSFCVDTARVYATGLSDGGLMASALTCALPDRIAAVGVVSGLSRPTACVRGRTVPIVAFWGTKDVVLPYCGGVGPAVAALASGNLAATPADPVCPPADQAGFPPVEDVVGEWARLDGCAASSQLRHVADDVEQRTYADCRGGAAVVLYSIVGGGHTWPGSKFMEAVSNAGVAIVGHTTVSIDATRVIWSFFQRYALPS